MAWTCKTCGESHEDVPLSFAADYPDNYAYMPDAGREQRAIVGSDQCVIDEKEFYVRGCLEIPINGTEKIFLWGLWASIWKDDYLEISECWEESGREKAHGPFLGRLSNSLRVYSQETFNLKLKVQLRPLGQRPLLFAEDENHPLAIAQRDGMTMSAVQDLVTLLMH